MWKGISKNEAYKENTCPSSGSANSNLHNPSGSCILKLERTTEGRADLDRVAGRGANNFIRWCHRCKHEIPEHLAIDVCDICGGDIVKMGE